MHAIFRQKNIDTDVNMPRSFAFKRGFTLIETLVAITVLMISVVGPLVFASQGLTNSIYAKDQITAFYLAQDAVEQIRNIRDTNAIRLRNGFSPAPSSWLEGLSNCMSPNVCVIQSFDDVNGTAVSVPIVNPSSVSCPSGKCPNISYDPTSYVYGYAFPSGVTPQLSQFNRSITITPSTSNPDEEILSVTIQWRSGSLNRVFTVRENIFNWGTP